MTKQDIENFVTNNKNVIVTTNAGSIIGIIKEINDNTIELKVAQCSYIHTDDCTKLEYAIISINTILSICNLLLDESKINED